jgi:hypothetical protein
VIIMFLIKIFASNTTFARIFALANLYYFHIFNVFLRKMTEIPCFFGQGKHIFSKIVKKNKFSSFRSGLTAFIYVVNQCLFLVPY